MTGARRRPGFTLMELTVYVGLASSMAGTILTVELSARRTAEVQAISIALLDEGARIAAALDADLRAASGAAAEEGGSAIRLAVPGPDGAETRVRYGPAGPGSPRTLLRAEDPAGGRRVVGIHVRSISFRAERGAWVAEWTLEARAGGRTLERTGRIVRTPRAAPGGTR